MNASIEMRFGSGIYLTPPLLGYDRDEEGNLIINEKEAKIVRLIFFLYLYGYTCRQIADTLTQLGSRDTPVWCMVYDGMDYMEEADTLAKQQKFVKPLMPYEIFMATNRYEYKTSLIEKRRKAPQCMDSERFQLPYRLETYNDSIARCVLQKVKVLDAEHLLVAFKGGAVVKQAFWRQHKSCVGRFAHAAFNP